MKLIDFVLGIENTFFNSNTERQLIANLESTYKRFSIEIPGYPQQIPVKMEVVDGKLFYRISLKSLNNLTIIREVGDIIFIVKNGNKIGFAFVQLKHAKKSIFLSGEEFLSTRSARAMNKGQLFLYSGLLEALNCKRGLFNTPDGYYLYSTYLLSATGCANNQYVILLPARHLFFDMHNPCHDFPLDCCSKFNHNYHTCCLNKGSQKFVGKVLSDMIFCSECVDWLKRSSRRSKWGLYLRSRDDTKYKLFSTMPSCKLLCQCANNSTAILYRWLRGILTNEFTVSKTKLKDIVISRIKNYTKQRLGQALFDLFISAFSSKKFCKAGFRNSCLLVDPPEQPYLLQPLKVSEKTSEITNKKRENSTEYILPDEYRKDLDLETDENWNTLLIFVGFNDEDLHRYRIEG